LKLFIDGTTVKNGHSGIGVYTTQIINGFSRTDRNHEVVCLGNESLLKNHLKDFRRNRIIQNSSNPHLAINISLNGNAPGVYADASFFPNYFMPPGWPWPSAVTIHDVSFITHPQFFSWKMRNWYAYRLQDTITNAKLILTVSDTSKKNLIRHLKIDPNRIRVHLPCKAKIYSDKLKPRDKPYLVYIGNIEPRKNLINLIKGYKQSDLVNTDLILIGKMHAPRSWAKQFHSMVAETPGVYYLGYLTDQEMYRYLINSQGFVNLSFVEGFGMSQLDALTNGIPVLISDDPAMMEVSQGHSMITRPDNISNIADCINELAIIPHYDAKKVAPLFHQKYSKEKYYEDLDNILDHVSEKKDPIFPGWGVGPMPEQAIIAGVTYAGVFSSGIHDDKLYNSLSEPIPDIRHFHLLLNKVFDRFPGRFHRKGRTTALKEIDIHDKNNGYKITQTVRLKHHRFLRIIGILPWIKAVYFSGGMVHGSGLNNKQDLDLFIVSKGNQVWIAYLSIRLLSKINGLNNLVCSNYLVDELSQEICWQRDFYTAFQLLFLRQVIRKKNTSHVRMYNRWIYDYFPNARQAEQCKLDSVTKGSGILYYLNLIIMLIWTSKWRGNGYSNGNGGMLWDLRRIKLHIHDHRPAVYKNYERLLHSIDEELDASYSDSNITR
jgi:glycosyltransferase involved in cell wall biosynthesis